MTPQSPASLGARFDVREYARTARGNHRDELQLADYATAPLDPESLHAIRYYARLESATMEHLRNLLVTATHKDARVTAFLVTWAFEKFWIADALDAVLEANGRPRAQDEDEGETRHSRSEASERRGPIRRALAAIAQGVPIIALHMAMGLVDEWVMRAAYERLAARSESAALSSTVALILDVKKRHAAFFEDEAVRRLTDSARAVRQTRRTLPRIAWPIGSIDRAAIDRSFFESYVFGGDEGAARARDLGTQVSALPGMTRSIGDAVAQGLRP
ncbi:hypothetical protein B0I08_10710 [Glaciihabitans tibetensis]|uniref:Uncharacterized protein n=1 Tax=Glaciihabitans tibetensis TaxID=1266600 RepID=A0A2T0VAP8_9MICO|nr:hypothetical protein [Glaciihabitans tibetensis]PRY67117.1 hypothetical protein B0I08_10710 [Glaciihabitans tibetensis]